eukprot:CAMPEP_0203870656 /NCGR_PEP_ID=MMETSP0359-20131031/18346_1 /ASSEMBLY_ACC=CAM_ASM_000338 /TAXON_ID=268821 /ORGANISM="Scrippsiella Hangoei, Strain SHTV-5" /LENGTH=572 /DNA_ID=CAMNT_0050789325 /DNA_START=6 /DNA_END=1724 /DNA_ORIENTATION=-
MPLGTAAAFASPVALPSRPAAEAVRASSVVAAASAAAVSADGTLLSSASSPSSACVAWPAAVLVGLLGLHSLGRRGGRRAAARGSRRRESGIPRRASAAPPWERDDNGYGVNHKRSGRKPIAVSEWARPWNFRQRTLGEKDDAEDEEEVEEQEEKDDKDKKAKGKKKEARQAADPKPLASTWDSSKDDDSAPVWKGSSPVFASAANAPVAAEHVPQRGPAANWDEPGDNVIERARRLAEDAWAGENGDEASGEVGGDDVEFFPEEAAEQARWWWRAERRIKYQQPYKMVSDYIDQNKLGKRFQRTLKRGLSRPKHFSGSDPEKNGLHDARADGNDTPYGRLANECHKGFLRLRATSHINGMVKGMVGQYPVAERPEVAFIGHSNAGKSSLLNAITRTAGLVPCGQEMGTTRDIRWYKPSKLPLDFIDLPGFGEAAGGSNFGGPLIEFICSRKSLRALYVLVDPRYGLRDADWDFLQFLGNRGPERIFVLTKCDMMRPKWLSKSATCVLMDIQQLPKTSPRLLMVSSKSGQGMHEVRMDLAARALRLQKKLEAKQKEMEKMEKIEKKMEKLSK